MQFEYTIDLSQHDKSDHLRDFFILIIVNKKITEKEKIWFNLKSNLAHTKYKMGKSFRSPLCFLLKTNRNNQHFLDKLKQ